MAEVKKEAAPIIVEKKDTTAKVLTPGYVLVSKKDILINTANLKSPLIIPFTEDQVHSMEIINEETFIATLTAQVHSVEIPPAKFIVIFTGKNFFEKEVTPELKAKGDDAIAIAEHKFESIVPFENKLSHIYDINSVTKQIVINADMYYFIRDVLEDNDHKVIGVAPDILIIEKEDNGEFLKSDAGKSMIFKKMLFLEKNSMEAPKKVTQPISAESPHANYEMSEMAEEPSYHNQKQMILMFGLPVFLLLLGLLGYMIYSQNQPPKKALKTNIVVYPTMVIAKPTLVASPTAALKEEAIKINVLNGSDKAGVAKTVSDALIKAGFKTITTGNSPNTPEKKTQVVFVPLISPDQRKKIIDVLSETFTEVSIKETDKAAFDVIITSGELKK